MTPRTLLGGPDLSGMEHGDAHAGRLGPLPPGGPDLIGALAASRLRGRGGAAFPVSVKWTAVAERSRGRAVVLANGAEGEPLSQKDRVLMEARPHLVLDGALLAAGCVGARRVILYVGAAHARAAHAMRVAVAERAARDQRLISMVAAPSRYVAGEESAAVHFVNDRVALPSSTPPRPYGKGVAGRPTLVHNVETLAAVALIARGGAPASLITLSGAIANPGVVEVGEGTTISSAVTAAGGITSSSRAVLLGGYFGGWVAADDAWSMPLDAVALRAGGHSLGCGVLSVLPADRCGVIESARILAWLAGQSARQCGPCVFGLRAIAEAIERVARAAASDPEDLERLDRWSQQVRGRGACHHPDGAAGFLESAMRVFRDEFVLHHEGRRCSLGVAA